MGSPSGSGKDIKRLRFTPDDDLVLLKEVIGENPLVDVEKWSNVQKNIFEVTGKKFTIRTLKDHLFLILEIWLKKDTDNQKKSGVEEVYSERDQLLQEISDICISANVNIKNQPKRKRSISKEKQIAELGKRAREKYAVQLELNVEAGPSTGNEALSPLFNEEPNLDHTYFGNTIPMSSSIINEEIILDVSMPDINTRSSSPPREPLNPVQPQSKIDSVENKKPDPKGRTLGPFKTRNNKGATTRRNALDYLQKKAEAENSLKAKELQLQERQIQIQERKLILEENRYEFEMFQRNERWEMEKEQLKQALSERNHYFKIIEAQQLLIDSFWRK